MPTSTTSPSPHSSRSTSAAYPTSSTASTGGDSRSRRCST
jgi:hypothetical protein